MKPTEELHANEGPVLLAIPKLSLNTKEPLSNHRFRRAIRDFKAAQATNTRILPCEPLFTRSSETLCPRHRQPFAVHIQVHQRKAGAQPLMVLFEPSVSHLLETKDALQNPERMFYLRPDSGLHAVLSSL